MTLKLILPVGSAYHPPVSSPPHVAFACVQTHHEVFALMPSIGLPYLWPVINMLRYTHETNLTTNRKLRLFKKPPYNNYAFVPSGQTSVSCVLPSPASPSNARCVSVHMFPADCTRHKHWINAGWINYITDLTGLLSADMSVKPMAVNLFLRYNS